MGKIKKPLSLFTACILFVILLIGMSSIPPLRKYPDREPVYFWHMWTSEWRVVVENICDRFNESQDRYEVVPLSLPQKAANAKFLLAVAGGSPPDCMAQWQQVVPQYAESKVIQPLDGFMTIRELINFQQNSYPIAQKIATYQGRPYCMPLSLDIRACYYRLDHLKQAGLLPADTPDSIKTEAEFQAVSRLLPQTLEELTEWGHQLHIFDQQGRMVRLGFLTQWLRLFAPVFGGGFYQHETKEITIKTPENLKALRFLKKESDRLGYQNLLRFRSSLTGRFGNDWPFVIGKRSITIDGQWRVQQLRQFAPDLPYITSPIPPPVHGGKKNAGWVFGNFMLIPTGAKNPQGAWEFIKFWTGLDHPDRAAEFYTQAGWLPPTPQVAETPHYRRFVKTNPQFKTFTDLLCSPNIVPPPPLPFQLFFFDHIRRADEAVMSGLLSPEAALKKLDEEIRAEQKRLKESDHET